MKNNIKSSDILRDLHIYMNNIEDLEKRENEINSFISTLQDFKQDIHNEKIGINEENLENKLIEWLDNLSSSSYWLTKYDDYYEIEYTKTSYDDRFTEEDVLKIARGKTKEERQDIFNEILFGSGDFYDYEYEQYSYLASEFCNDTNYIEHDTEIQDILVNLVYFNYNTYLEDTYNINLLIDFKQQDNDTEFSNSSDLENCKNNNLYTLLKTQGYTKKDYENNLKTKDNKFLNSVKEEILNCTYEYGNTLVALKEMTLEEIIENDNFLISTNNMIGLFNAFNGSGSILEIELEKDFTIDRNKDIYDIQVEDARNNYNYTVNEVYGLIGSCWK